MDGSVHKTLKQKWIDHWDKKDKLFSPSKQMNILGMIFFWCFTASLMFTALHIIIPTYASSMIRHAMSIAVYLIFIESSVNWVLTALPWRCKVEPRLTGAMEELPYGWKNCVTCQLSIPPRAHHCKICNMCILKRDHHCFFTGACVGFQNQRNFIFFMFYIAVGSLYGLVLLFAYLQEIWPLFSKDSINYIPFIAFWKLIFGYVSIGQFVFLVQFYICCMMAVVASWFFILEAVTVVKGITWHEAEKGLRTYEGGPVRDNIKAVFGDYWFLQFLLPIPMKLAGDGYKWETRKSN